SCYSDFRSSLPFLPTTTDPTSFLLYFPLMSGNMKENDISASLFLAASTSLCTKSDNSLRVASGQVYICSSSCSGTLLSIKSSSMCLEFSLQNIRSKKGHVFSLSIG